MASIDERLDLSRIRPIITAVTVGMALSGALLFLPSAAQAASGCPATIANQVLSPPGAVVLEQIEDFELDEAKSNPTTCYYTGQLYTYPPNVRRVPFGPRSVTVPQGAPHIDSAPKGPIFLDEDAQFAQPPPAPAPVEQKAVPPLVVPVMPPVEVPSPSPSLSASPSVSASPSGSASPSDSASPSVSAAPAESPATVAGLPVTGASVTLVVAIAVLLVAGGVTAFLISHRHQKIRFMSH